MTTRATRLVIDEIPELKVLVAEIRVAIRHVRRASIPELPELKVLVAEIPEL